MYIKFRPYLREFLDDMKELYEIVIYTSADKDYADRILDFIEGKDKKYFEHRLYCEQCLIKEGSYIFKHLELLCSNRQLKDILIVDNSVKNFGLFVRNGVPITDYNGCDTDYQLAYLGNYLRMIAGEDDVRNIIKHDFADFLLHHYQST